ncbi:hypothetical protein MHYP_G00208470 [Metynnis hypsauchen]
MKELIEEMNDTGYGYGYECAVANRFGKLLDDESDPFDLLHQARVQQERKKKMTKLPDVPPKTGKESGPKQPVHDQPEERRVRDQPEERAERRVRDQPEERAERRVRDQPEERAERRVRDQPEERAERRVRDQPEERAERRVRDQPEERAERRVRDQPEERAERRVRDQPEERAERRVRDQPEERAERRVRDQPEERAERRVRDQPEERAERRVAFYEPRFNEGGDFLRFSTDRPRELFDRAGRRGGGGGGGRGHGARGAGYPRSSDGYDPRGKREFDRHSGSDRASVRPEEKRGGSGPHNWGSMRDHVSAMTDALPNEEIVESEEALEIDEVNQPFEKEVVEVAIEMSLDEWKSMQAQSKPKTEFNIRKADTKLPSKAVVIHKSKHIEKHADGISEDDVVFRRPANDITFQMEINFGKLARPSRGGRGGRGGRGRGVIPTRRSPEKSVDMQIFRLCWLGPVASVLNRPHFLLDFASTFFLLNLALEVGFFIIAVGCANGPDEAAAAVWGVVITRGTGKDACMGKVGDKKVDEGFIETHRVYLFEIIIQRQQTKEMESKTKTSQGSGSNDSEVYAHKEQLSAQPKTDLRLVLLGGDSADNSYACSTILRDHQREEAINPLKGYIIERTIGGRQVSIFRTPSNWMEHLASHLIFSNGVESIRHEIQNCTSTLFPGPHAFLLVMRAGHATGKEHYLLRAITSVFGAEALEYTMVIFIHVHEQNLSRATLKDRCVQMCGERFYVLENNDENVEELFMKIETMTQKKESRFFVQHSYENLMKTCFKSWENARQSREKKLKRELQVQQEDQQLKESELRKNLETLGQVEKDLSKDLEASRLNERALRKDLEASRLNEIALRKDLEASRLNECALRKDLEASRLNESALRKDLEASRLNESALRKDLEASRLNESALRKDLEASRQDLNKSDDRSCKLQREVEEYKEREKELQQKLKYLQAQEELLRNRLEKQTRQKTEELQARERQLGHKEREVMIRQREFESGVREWRQDTAVGRRDEETDESAEAGNMKLARRDSKDWLPPYI